MRELKRGDEGDDVKKVQEALRQRVVPPIVADGKFGPKTEAAVQLFQARQNLPVTGVVDERTAAMLGFVTVSIPGSAGEYLRSLKFVRAQHFRQTNGRAIRKIVMHTMEALERLSTAEACSSFFASPGTRNGVPIIASAHLCIDADSIVKCVEFQDVAFAAPGLNNDGIHIELAGFARQTASEWEDEFSSRMLRLAAKVMAAISIVYEIPLVQLVPDDLLDPNSKGVTTHHAATIAFKKVGGHTDPGPNFPMLWLLDQANEMRTLFSDG